MLYLVLASAVGARTAGSRTRRAQTIGRASWRASDLSGSAIWACRWRRICIKAGHQVEGVDVNPAAVDKLVAAGGAGVETAKIAAARADVVITMLPAGKHVREVYLGAGGIIENANAGTLLIDCSTIDVETARAVASAAEAKGLLMIDAPVSGGVGGAQAAR